MPFFPCFHRRRLSRSVGEVFVYALVGEAREIGFFRNPIFFLAGRFSPALASERQVVELLRFWNTAREVQREDRVIRLTATFSPG
jgi:hypothetical protein